MGGYSGAGLEKCLYVIGERVWLFTFDVYRANHGLACTVEDRNNDLRPGRAKGGEIPWIGRDIPDVHCSPGENGGAGQPLANRKRRILRRTGAAPDNIFHYSRGVVHVIKPDPAVAAGAPKKLRDVLKSGDPILRRGNEAVEVLHQVVALHEHIAHYAHYK